MESVLNDLRVIREALGTLQITSTRHNLDTLLGCMQLLDRVTDRLSQQTEPKEAVK